MSPSPSPDNDAWPGPPGRSGPRPPRLRRPKHPWLTAILVLAGLILSMGVLGSLLTDDQEPTSGTVTPPQTSATQPPGEPDDDTTPTPRSSPEPRGDPTPPATTAPSPEAGVVVVRVIDGDTIEVRGDGRILPEDTVARVRLLQIDTPERGACFADQATARTSTLLPPGSRVRAERDVELMDPYDRYLLYVWNEQGTFVNESLVRSGHAEAVLYPPNDKHWSTISGAEDAARQSGAGLWAACSDAPDTSPPPDRSPTEEPARPGLPEGPPAGAPDVDCSDLSGPVRVGPDDPHRLDRDGDGIGCDAN